MKLYLIFLRVQLRLAEHKRPSTAPRVWPWHLNKLNNAFAEIKLTLNVI